MLIKKKKYTTIWYEKGTVKIIDQTKLPFSIEIANLESIKDFFLRLKT